MPRGDQQRIAAEATTDRDTVTVRLRQAGVTPAELPEAVLHYVLRTQDSVILDDAAAPNLFAADVYLRQQHARSVLCLPLVKQAQLTGVLYLENTLASHVFTPARLAVLRLLASQAAIALDNARLYRDLQEENRERQQAEDALRESEQRFRDYAEMASDWLWETGPDHRFTEVSEHLRATTVGIDPASRIGVRRWDFATDVAEEPEKWRAHIATIEAHQPFRDFRYRTTRRDGTVLYMTKSGTPVFDGAGRFRGYRGVSSDVSAAVRAAQAEEALHQAQAALAHVTRVLTLSEITTSIAHEVNQPLAAIVTNGNACVRWRAGDPPNLGEAREAVEAMIRDGHRASDVIRRIRALVQNTPPRQEWLDINALLLEVIALVHSDGHRQGVALQTDLAADLPRVAGDRIQVQQVLLNLLMNGLEALCGVPEGARELRVSSGTDASQAIRVAVCDTGIGLAATSLDRLFDAFYTTKPEGLGLGLAISRAIIEAHGATLVIISLTPVRMLADCVRSS